MNRYGRLAMEHWRKYAPQRYAALGDDPASYFTDLGETIESEVANKAEPLDSKLPKDLDYLDRAGQMTMHQKMAEEAVLRELVYSVEIESGVFEELDEMLGSLPSPSMIESSLTDLRTAAEEEAEWEGWSGVLYDEQTEAKIAQLKAALPLVDCSADRDEMSEAEARDRILALLPFWDHMKRGLRDV